MSSDGEAFIHLTEEQQKECSTWILDTKFVAAVEKSRWGADQRWGYSIVGLNSDFDTVARLQAKPRKAKPSPPPTIDLAGGDASSPTTSSNNSKRGSTPYNNGRNHAKRSKPPLQPWSGASSTSDSDDGSAISSDDGDDDYNPSDASDSDPAEQDDNFSDDSDDVKDSDSDDSE